MEPRIEIFPETKLVGKFIRMTLSEQYRTRELWQSFMPFRKTIPNTIGEDLFCVQIYDTSSLSFFSDPNASFEKWAAAKVTDYDNVPSEMKTLTIPESLYAVFIHKGAATTGEKTFRYIFETWLPGSSYTMDNRPHFEILGDKYKNDDPSSEEEIWIPVKIKA